MFDKQLNFKKFIINENQQLFGTKVGDLLSSLQELLDEYKNIGVRFLAKSLAILAEEIRSIIQGHWPSEQRKNLKILQQIGIALSKLKDEKDDIEGTLQSCIDALNDMLKMIGVPVNDIGVPSKEEPAQIPGKENTSKSTELDINPAVQPESGFDLSGAAPLGSPPENQNPNAL